MSLQPFESCLPRPKTSHALQEIILAAVLGAQGNGGYMGYAGAPPPPPAPPSVTFLALGRWGVQARCPPRQPRAACPARLLPPPTAPARLFQGAFNQTKVAASLGAAAQQMHPAAIVSTGDSFLLGLANAMDMSGLVELNASFTSVYTHPALAAVPWHAVYGERDYFSPVAAAETSSFAAAGDPRWHAHHDGSLSLPLPGAPPGAPPAVALVFVDTTPWIPAYRPVYTAKGGVLPAPGSGLVQVADFSALQPRVVPIAADGPIAAAGPILWARWQAAALSGMQAALAGSKCESPNPKTRPRSQAGSGSLRGQGRSPASHSSPHRMPRPCAAVPRGRWWSATTACSAPGLEAPARSWRRWAQPWRRRG